MLQSSVISHGGELHRIDTSHCFIFFSFSENEIKYITNIQLFFLFVHIEFDTVHLYTLFYKSVSHASCSAVNKHTVKDMVSNVNSQSFTKVANRLAKCTRSALGHRGKQTLSHLYLSFAIVGLNTLVDWARFGPLGPSFGRL